MEAAATAGLGSGIMNIDVEFHIRHNYPWSKLPTNVKQVWLRPASLSPDLRTVGGLEKLGVLCLPRRLEGCPPDSPRTLARRLYKPGACDLK